MDGTVEDRRRRIGLREVRAIGPGEMVWDAAVSGFGIRRQQSAAVSYVLFYRMSEGRQRWITIGRHGSGRRFRARYDGRHPRLPTKPT
ncbi:hypothetical protein ACFFMP_04340 [Pseudoroseomonas cervicalis]|uniref:Uncharacterized protein n=1 Tax=Pseudoroseomonas cervicalis ATCC 49957 TaxID=525371 RepID=D5RKT5_9PROT|nr:hypothetical protein [Pseudoroseomonas cervicalis]EFH12081.1 hypothetical protein HMPREF0731_1695 [Pseudoroseomonas cervicalis ATCC 49957]